MHDPEEFQEQTIKAIADLQNTFGQTVGRQLALGAMVQALVRQMPLEALFRVREEYEAEVDQQASSLPPKFQRQEFWAEWSELLDDRIRQLEGPSQPPV